MALYLELDPKTSAERTGDTSDVSGDEVDGVDGVDNDPLYEWEDLHSRDHDPAGVAGAGAGEDGDAGWTSAVGSVARLHERDPSFLRLVL